MEQNAEIQQNAPLLADAQREHGITHEPCQHADQQHIFHAQAAEQQRDNQHEDDLRHLPEGHGGADVGNPGIRQIRGGVGVVGAERDGNQHRADGEDEEVAGFEQRKGIRAEEIAHLHRQAFRRGGRVRQRQAVDRQQHGAYRRHLEDGDAGRHAGDTDENARRDPADGAEHAHYREGFIHVRQAVKRNVVGQRQRRHIAERVAKQQANQQRAVLSNQRPRHEPEDRRAREVHHRHHLLRGKEAVHQHPEHERRENGSDRPGRERVANQQRHVVLAHHQAKRDRPATPDKKLQKHHQRQTRHQQPVLRYRLFTTLS
ncbi:Uncharacterised protein [Enterobacter hormaechei]|nr:Uncharacterised protein [Enterobacter hormaechei]